MTAHLMRVAFAPRQVRATKRKLLWSCAAAAILVTAGTTAQQARAQAFLGTPTLPNPNIAVSGSATRNITSPTTETITVGSPTATINWIPSDNDGSGTIDFLPAGNVATFTNDPSTTADYTVLNRILPSQTRPIGLNGTVISQLQDLSENVSTGGHVWFYSPNGIIVGATALFDVGSLLLTVNDPVSFSTSANGFTGHFVGATDSTASVTIDPGAKISASPENSYVALVAPRVVQSGDVGVNGSAAYVAGEDVTLTMNQGLFDIQVDVGTTDANGVVHDGTTGGPASGGAGDNQRIYMVAVPKNQALTMLLSGNAGFTPAGAAQVVNGEIVLSAGWSIFDTTGARSVSTPIFADASIDIDTGTYTSNVFGIARGNITAVADIGTIDFLGNVNLNTYDAGNTGNVILGAQADNGLTVGGSVLMNSSNPANSSVVSLYADDFGFVDIAGSATLAAQAGPGDGGDATISADNDGQINIGGTAYVAVSGAYFSAADAGLEQFAGSAFGGSINVTAFNDGLITTGGMNLSANGTGQDSIGGDAGSGYGGYINVQADSGGDIQVNGVLNALASGFGGDIFNGTFGSGTLAGYGGGGSIYAHVGDGTIGVTGDALLQAGGTGGTIGDSGSGSVQYGGSGSGGYAFLYSDGPGTITVGGATNLDVQGFGGDGVNGGSGYGGSAGIYAYDGTIDLGPTIGLFATAWGGAASFGFGGYGGYGGGGTAYIKALANPGQTFGTITADAGGSALVYASGYGGTGGAGNSDNAAGAGGNGQGGVDCGECSGGAYVLAQVDGAQLTLGNVDVRAEGYGGTGGTGGAGQAGGAGGTGYGGFTQAGLFDDPFDPTGETTGSASFGDLALSSDGLGGAGGSSLFQQGDGGWGFGGDAQFLSFASNATASSLSLLAVGQGGSGGLVGGDGYGGTVTVSADGGNIDVTSALFVTADGLGGSASAAGTGGTGYGGSVELTLDGGSISVADDLLVFASGEGGAGAAGGDGFGGTITGQITSNGGSLSVGSLMRMEAEGQGGAGLDNPDGAGGNAGGGYGGMSEFTVADTMVPDASASLDLGDTYIRANGLGGNGGNGITGGDGGDGFGGTASYYLGSGTASAGELLASTTPVAGNGGNGSDGAGGAGGDAYGGLTTITIGGDQTASIVYSLSRALAGNGGSGTVDGDGGYAQAADASIDVLAGAQLDGDIEIGVNAIGGNGGNGGDAFAGDGALSVAGTLTSGNINLDGEAVGGNGSSGSGGNAYGGDATLDAFGGTISAIGLNSSAATITVGADAIGGNSNSGQGGNANSGNALVTAESGGSITSGTVGSGLGSLTASANATGGIGYDLGGDASAGTVYVTADGGDITTGGDLSMLLRETGGNATGTGIDSIGGNGYGSGELIFTANDANVTVGGTLLLSANSNGGGGDFGNDATASYNDLSIGSGATVSAGVLTQESQGFGGAGMIGGNGTGGDVSLSLWAADASLDVAGTVEVLGRGFGGIGIENLGGTSGLGGDGAGGSVTVRVYGDMTTGDLNLRASGFGGDVLNGLNGGDAGSGTGGTSSLIIYSGGSLDSAIILNRSLGFGGDGGIGSTGYGGDGGNATGGSNFLTVEAGGSLTATGYYAYASAPSGFDVDPETDLLTTAGGNGGTGGSGSGAGGDAIAGSGSAIIAGTATVTNDFLVTSYARGGEGSSGGNATAGSSSITIDGTLSAGGTVQASASAQGGNGDSGAGGSATAGTATLAVNGALDAGDVWVITNAFGGTGSSFGDSFGGFAQFFASGSTIDAGDITLTATGNFGGVAELSLFGSELTANSLTLNVNGVASAGTASLGVGTDPFGPVGSILTLNAFTANANGGANGDIFVSVDDGSSADLGVANLSALGPGGGGEIHEIDITIGGTPLLLLGGIGTLGLNNTVLTADSLNLSSGGTIDITSFNGASIDVAGLFHADAGGAMTLDDVDDTAVVRADVIDFHADSFTSSFDILGRVIGIFSVQDLDVTSTVLLADETLTLSSDNDVIAGDLSAGLAINLSAGGNITAGDLNSGGDISAYALNNITLGDITAAGRVDLLSDGSGGLGNIIFGDVSADILDFSADGTVTGGDIVAVTKATGDAQGAIVLGNITVTGPEAGGDFSVGIGSETSIDVGNVSAVGRVGFATLGDLTTGNITAGPLFLALVSGDVTVGSVTTAPSGQVYIADSSMFLANGGPDDFDPAPVLAASPVPTGGSITITGPVSTGQFRAAAGDNLTTGAITAGSAIDVSAGNDIVMGVLNSGDAITATAGHNLQTGNITATDRVRLIAANNVVFANVTADSLKFEAGGTANGGNIVANTRVNGDANGAITLGNITAGPGLPPVGEASVAFTSQASIAVGNVQGADAVGFAAGGDLTVGNVQAGSLLLTLVHGNVSLGSVTTAPTGRVYMADSSMFATGGGVLGVNTTNSDFDAAVVLALAPVATGGSINITGPVSTGRFQAAAGIDLHTANVTAGTSIEGSAGHDILAGNLSAGTTVGETAGHVISMGNVAFGQSVTLDAGNTIVAGNLTGGHNVTFTAGNNSTVGGVAADGTATFTAGGLARFLGHVGVPTITVTSGDIDVPLGGELGIYGVTNLLTLNAVSDNPIIIGSGPALVGPHYVLHEDGDLSAATLVINAVGADGPDPDVIVYGASPNGSLAPQPSVNHIILNTDASVLVEGQVLFTGASATDSLAINAGHSIQINTTNGGGIAMVNTAEDRPSGLLTLTSDDIWAGSQSLLDQLNANVNFAGRDALVGTNPGAEVAEGYLIAGGMTLSLADTLFVQNSGAGQAYAGITVGAGGLTVATTGAAPAQVVAYGRRMNPDGTFVTGNQFFGQVNFTKTTSHYTALSEFNECLINTGCSGGGGGGGGAAGGGGTLGPEAILGPVDLMGNPEETIELAASEDQGQAGSDGEDGQDGGSGSVDWSSQLFGTGGLSDDALVDEGVTSGGDNNQWDSQVCKPTSPDQPCPEKAPPADKQEQ